MDDNTNTKSQSQLSIITKKDSILTPHPMFRKRSQKPKKTVSFKENNCNNHKLFYKTSTFDKNSSIKSILKIKRSSSFFRSSSYKSTSSGNNININTNTNGNSNSNLISSSKPKKCVFKTPLTIVKQVISISQYYNDVNNEKNTNDDGKASCSCACVVF